MTRPAPSALVLEGNTVKARLFADRLQSKVPVHVDWLRFSIHLRNAPAKVFDRPFSDITVLNLSQREELKRYEDREHSAKWLHDYLRELEHDKRYSAAGQAHTLALQVVDILGHQFTVAPMAEKGHDFYAKRWPILHGGVEAGWVGFGASSDKPTQQQQANTLHVNLYGRACTFAPYGWKEKIADFIEDLDGWLTRIDLALDFFDGHPSAGMDDFVNQYRSGLMDVYGKRPATAVGGDWPNERARSLYIGSRNNGKLTNIYEKGHQLYGADSGNPWLRIETRFGNQVRELNVEMIRRPADFFAGTSEWHAGQLREAEKVQFTPEVVPVTPQLQVQTVEAEAFRALRWVKHTARANLTAAFNFLGESAFLELVSSHKLPGRLRGFALPELRTAYDSAAKLLSLEDSGQVPLAA